MSGSNNISADLEFSDSNIDTICCSAEGRIYYYSERFSQDRLIALKIESVGRRRELIDDADACTLKYVGLSSWVSCIQTK